MLQLSSLNLTESQRIVQLAWIDLQLPQPIIVCVCVCVCVVISAIKSKARLSLVNKN